jgi:hypothetical protein
VVDLKNSSVKFDQESHTYTTEDGVILSGVTAMLSEMIFKNKYANVPEFILNRAARHGTFVHECCELADTLHIDTDCPEQREYSKERAKLGFIHVASEFLISDEENIASSIDKVFEKDGEIHLADIKTTYKLDEEWLSWQLSVYAYLFERQTGKKVAKLWSIWLRDGKCQFKEVTRKPDAAVKKLIKCFVDGKPFEDASVVPARKVSELPAQYAEIEGFIEDVVTQCAYWSEQKKQLAEGVMKEMVKRGDYKWEGDTITFIRKKESIRKTFDTESFRKDHPMLYDKYIKEVPMVGSVTVKIKNN